MKIIIKPLDSKRILLSLFLGSITVWLVKEEVTPLLLGGKHFAARSVLVQAGIIFFLLILISVLYFTVIAVSGDFFLRIFEVTRRELKVMAWKVRIMMSKEKFLPELQIDLLLLNLQSYLRENAYLIITLSIIAVAAYGFELFNFNLTIDEEIHANQYGPLLEWVRQGRWGMYLLNKFLLPYTVIPFVPLFLALVFYLVSILLLLDAWNVKSKIDRVVLGTIGLAFPTMAYIYTFSTINYGVGFGFLCVALSIFVYSKGEGWIKFLAIIPAALSIAIYQAFVPVLISVFLIYILTIMISTSRPIFREIVFISIINICAVVIYYVVQKWVLFLFHISESGYVLQYLDLKQLLNDFLLVVGRLWSIITAAYFGNKSIYSVDVKMLGVLLVVSLLGIIWRLLYSKRYFVQKLFIIFLLIILLILPFSFGLLSQGVMGMRVVIALPIVVMGLCALGMDGNPKVYRAFVIFVATFCFLQFITSTNHLFASSHLALQEDRLLAAQLIDEIEEAKEKANAKDVQYLEVVGYVSRPSTELIPKIETFGSSFFEWDGGNVGRIVLFMKTIGYTDLDFLPSERKVEMIQTAELMPKWPEKGSVKVLGDTVLVKFDSYSYSQRVSICNSNQNVDLLQSGFCP